MSLVFEAQGIDEFMKLEIPSSREKWDFPIETIEMSIGGELIDRYPGQF
jgi:hypothetical protein